MIDAASRTLRSTSALGNPAMNPRPGSVSAVKAEELVPGAVVMAPVWLPRLPG